MVGWSLVGGASESRLVCCRPRRLGLGPGRCGRGRRCHRGGGPGHDHDGRRPTRRRAHFRRGRRHLVRPDLPAGPARRLPRTGGASLPRASVQTGNGAVSHAPPGSAPVIRAARRHGASPASRPLAGDAGGRHRGRRRTVAARRPDDGRRAGRGVGDRTVAGRRRARSERAVCRGAAVAAPVAPEVRTDEMPVPAPKVGAPTGSSPSVVIVSRAAAPVAPPVAPASPWTEPEPADPQRTSRLSLSSRHCRRARSADDAASAGSVRTADDDAQPADPGTAAEPAAPVSRPLSDPDLTPLMGIPIIRPSRGRRAARGRRLRPRRAARPGARGAPSPRRPVPGPSPRVAETFVPDDDEVVLMSRGPHADVPRRPAAGRLRQPAARVVPGGPPRRRAGRGRRRRPARRPRPRGRHHQDRHGRRRRAAQPRTAAGS